MSNSYEHMSDIFNAEYIDDFKLIRGIGPAIERRLHEAGILSYEQLSSKSPEDLADIFLDFTGLSAERILKQGWTEQALELAQQRTNTLSEIEYPNNGQHYAVYTVELLLDDENDVRRTRVMHVQSHKEDTWAGWQADRLQSFFIDSADLRIPQAHPEGVVMKGTEVDRKPASPLSPATHGNSYASTELIKGQLSLIQTEQQSVDIRTPLGSIPANRNFNLTLQVDLSAFDITSAAQPKYSATVYAKALGSNLRQAIGNSSGKFILANEVTVNVVCDALQAGSYHLEAIVMFSPPDQEPKLGIGPVSIIKGGLLQVY